MTNKTYSFFGVMMVVAGAPNYESYDRAQKINETHYPIKVKLIFKSHREVTRLASCIKQELIK